MSVLHKSNTREAGKAREIETLKAIGLCGWMTTRTIALWVYTDSTLHVATNKAQLVLKRLKLAEEVKSRKLANGYTAWILTRKGADRVNLELEAEGYEKGWAHHGYDAGTLDYVRHITTIEFLAQKRREQDIAGAVGKAGLRAGLVPEFKECDGAYITYKNGCYTVVGVLAITNARGAIVDKLRRLKAQKLKIDLAGEPRIIATVRRREVV
ncbi:hypothetical protein [Ralstonia sp. RRA.1]|uniref:hypothetical protein n=1 Tax=Ralstonia sp. RRA TaxID=3122075 RepID=UPI0030D2FA68